MSHAANDVERPNGPHAMDALAGDVISTIDGTRTAACGSINMHRAAGVVTPEEARAIFLRYHRKATKSGGDDRLTFRVPVDPKTDDDIRLGAFIANTEELVGAARALLDPAFLESAPYELPSSNGPFARFMRALQRFEVRR